MRYFATSPLSSLTNDDQDLQEASRIISQLAPFLTDRKSKVLHSSLDDVITDVWSRFEPVNSFFNYRIKAAVHILLQGNIDAKLFSLLLRDTAQLLRPQVVTAISPTANAQDAGFSIDSSHPSIFTILALSDLSKVLELADPPKTAPDKPESHQNHITFKLSFYVAQILSTPPAILGRVTDEILARSRVIEREAFSPPARTAEHDILPSTFHNSRRSGQVPGIGPDLIRGDDMSTKPKIEMVS